MAGGDRFGETLPGNRRTRWLRVSLSERRLGLRAEPRRARQGRRAKRERLHDSLRQMILDGVCPPGSRLMQNELAQQLGTSVNSVREALFELRYAGFVEKRDGIGFFVREVTNEDFIDAWELYNLHQSFAARLCCRNARRRDLDELRELAQTILDHASSECREDLQEIPVLDRRFHDRVMRIAGSRVLDRAVETYFMPMLDVDVTSEKCRKRARESYREHLAVVEAIEQNRPSDAERLMRDHYVNNMRCFEGEWAERGNPTVHWHGRSVDFGDTPVYAISFGPGGDGPI